MPATWGSPNEPSASSIEAIFVKHGVRAPWSRLVSVGLANWVYVTDEVVLRVATNHPEGVSDARTESVAAPAAHAAGIMTPRMIAFDDSRAVVDRPYSLWERVHGAPLRLTGVEAAHRARVWYEVGYELARLHSLVKECPDPNNYLDTPARELEIDGRLKRLVDAGRVSRKSERDVAALTRELEPDVSAPVQARFLHNDVHDANVMCSDNGYLAALIDWGDAGWGDPTIEFAAIPLDGLRFALAGYEASPASRQLGDHTEARLVWDKLVEELGACERNPSHEIRLQPLRAFLDS